MWNSGPKIDSSLAAVYRQAREAVGPPISGMDSWALALLVGVDSVLEVLDGAQSGPDPQQ